MRNLLALLGFVGLASTASAADIVCGCADGSCSDIKISILPSNPGVYLNIEFVYGEKNTEGFAQVTHNTKDQSVLYTLGNFFIVEKNNVYTLPNKKQVCN